MAATDRQRIRAAAREHGWSEELSPPHSVTFYKGQRSVHVTFDRQTHTTPVEAFYGGKRLRARNLTGDIIGNLKKA